MTKADIERWRDWAEAAGGNFVSAGPITLLASELATLCRIALIAIAAREQTRKEVDD